MAYEPRWSWGVYDWSVDVKFRGPLLPSYRPWPDWWAALQWLEAFPWLTVLEAERVAHAKPGALHRAMRYRPLIRLRVDRVTRWKREGGEVLSWRLRYWAARKKPRQKAGKGSFPPA